jgi:hypothetical protein
MVRFILILSLLTTAMTAKADVLFEGYYKISAAEKHVGYVISRYEFDNKKKQFIATYLLKTSGGGMDVTESLKAYADSELGPISYEYTTVAGAESKTVDAKFKNGTMTASITEGKKVNRIEKKVPKGTFLSAFLTYLMLKSKEGLKSETKYEYQAIAEEEASIQKGQALVGKEETFNGFKAFKILNTFKDSKFLSYVNERGEVLGINAMGQGVSTELVATPALATAGLPVSQTIVKALFGNIPAGMENIVSHAEKVKGEMKNQPAPSKQQGVPQGQGIILKGQPEKSGEKGK